MVKTRILQFFGDPTGSAGHGYTVRAQLELSAVPPIGSSLFLLNGGIADEYTIHEVQLVVGVQTDHHFALLVAPIGAPYRKSEGLVSPPWHPDQPSFTMHSG